MMWIAFSLIGGAVGIVVSILRHWLFTPDTSLYDAIIIEMINGAFYTYSIALIASVLGSVFINFVDNEQFRYRKYKLGLIAISVYALLFGGILYALSIHSYSKEELERIDIHFSWGQIVIMIIALVLSVYAFFVCRMDEHTDLFDDVVERFNETKDVPDYPKDIPDNF